MDSKTVDHSVSETNYRNQINLLIDPLGIKEPARDCKTHKDTQPLSHIGIDTNVKDFAL